MRVLLLGGYGNFGRLIARELARDSNLDVVIAGRNAAAAASMAETLQRTAVARFQSVCLDVNASDLTARFAAMAPDLVIHTCGPFQGSDYRVAESAIAAGAHYIDLADARDFVAGIGQLDALARARDRLITAGTSTVPALSAAVIDHYHPQFRALRTIDIGVSPGNRSPRGAATVAAILSYVGRPLKMWINGQWRSVTGWQNLRRERYPHPVGPRWLANCDVPDLSLFVPRYAGVESVRFGAGLELRLLHFGLWLLSWLVRWRMLPRLDRWTRALKRISEWLQSRGSDAGAMHVRLGGTGADGAPLTLTWTLVAGSGHGPQVPASAAVALARKLARGDLHARGAMPCMGLLTLQECLAALADYDIRVDVQRERT